MYNHKSFTSKVGGLKHNVNVFDLSDNGTEVVKTAPATTHHILLIDRSGSMSGVLDTLIDQVIEITSRLPKTDLLTVAWYSGVDQCRVAVSKAKLSEDLSVTLNDLRRTVGLTCFSTAVEMSVKEITSEVDQNAITLFTDGCPAVPWSESEELNRVVKSIESVGNTLMAFNCIGYGNYYNKQFLNDLSNKTQYGLVFHNSQIDQFLRSYEEILHGAEALIPAKIEISLDPGYIYDVIYVGNSVSTASFDVEGAYVLKHIDREGGKLFIVSETNPRFIDLDGEAYPRTTEKVAQSDKDDLFYAYSHYLYRHGRRMKALDVIVNNVRDKAIADKMINAFTAEEVSEVEEMGRLAISGSQNRHLDGKCPAGYLPAKDAFCIMDLFGLMMNSEDPVYYIPYSKNVESYKRIGRKTEDKDNRFTPVEGEVRAELKEFVWNKEHLNLSIRFDQKGTVKLNAKAAKRVNLPETYETKIYRTHTFIKDGSLNIRQAEFLIPLSLVSTTVPTREGTVRIASPALSTETIDGKEYGRWVWDLSKIPVINRQYVEDIGLDSIYDLVKKSTELEARQKVLGFRIKDLEDSMPSMKKTGTYTALTLDQIQVLEDHGIRKDGVYGGIENVKPSAEESDSYMTRTMTFYLSGFSSFPTVKDYVLMTEKKKNVNKSGQMLIDQDNSVFETVAKNSKNDKELLLALQKDLKSSKEELIKIRHKIGSVKMGKILNNDFFEGLDKDAKGNLVFEDEKITTIAPMVVRTDRTVEYI